MQTLQSPPKPLWCADRFVANIDGPGLQDRFAIDRPFLFIGSSPRCDIRLPLHDNVPVSLFLLATRDKIHWIDLASPTAQWRSGAFDGTGCLVWRGYHLDLQRVRSADSPPSNPATAASFGPDERPTSVPILDVSCDGDHAARAKLTHTLTLVGHSDRCRLRLRNRHVAAAHALFFVHRQQAWIVDLLSGTGTFVNGERVAVAQVHAGEKILVGKPWIKLIRWSDRRPLDADLDSGIGRKSSEAAPAIPVPRDPALSSPKSLSETVVELEALRSTISDAPASDGPALGETESAPAFLEAQTDCLECATVREQDSSQPATSEVAQAPVRTEPIESPLAQRLCEHPAGPDFAVSALFVSDVHNSREENLGASPITPDSPTEVELPIAKGPEGSDSSCLIPTELSLTPATFDSPVADSPVAEPPHREYDAVTLDRQPQTATVESTRGQVGLSNSEQSFLVAPPVQPESDADRIPPAPPSSSLETMLDDPLLNHLIDRHQHDRRTRAIRWALATALCFAVVGMGGVAIVSLLGMP